jgi:hypothetical protein
MILRRRLLEAGAAASTLYATPPTLAFSPEPSTRGVVNVT